MVECPQKVEADTAVGILRAILSIEPITRVFQVAQHFRVYSGQGCPANVDQLHILQLR